MRGARIILAGFLALSLMHGCSHSRSKGDSEAKAIEPDEQAALKASLSALGIDAALQDSIISRYNQRDWEKVMRLNIGAMENHAAVPKKYEPSKRELQKNKKFLIDNKSALKNAYKLFGVSSEYICALLWIETMHGGLKGRYHIPDVYSALLFMEQPSVRQALLDSYRSEYEPRFEKARIEAWLDGRIKRKVEWAKSELQALNTIQQSKHMDVMILRGSYAGAFGLPQFLPSSYLKWSFATVNGTDANLFKVGDAIFSAANYLHLHGWDEADTEKKKQAIFAYNQSSDYVDSIMTLAGRLKPPLKRGKKSIASSKN